MILFTTRGIATLGLALVLGACAAVFPEMKTPVRTPSGEALVEPPPGDDLFLIYFERALVPNRTRDGREWDPNPFAQLVVNGEALVKTPVAYSNRKPTWPDERLANYRVRAHDEVWLELWDDGALSNVPICRRRIWTITEFLETRNQEVECDGGARVWLRVAPARPLLGLGLSYELRGSDGVRVTRVIGQSPASRAGLSEGDRILAIQGQPVMTMDTLGIKSKINTHSRTGLELDVWFVSGERRKIVIKEEAMYPLFDDETEIPQERLPE